MLIKVFDKKSLLYITLVNIERKHTKKRVVGGVFGGDGTKI